MSKSDKFLNVTDVSRCLNCNNIITIEKAYSFSPPDKFVHLICNPENVSIKFCRNITGLSQRELANAFGVTTETIRDWENGRSPHSNQMILCQKFLGNYLNEHGIEGMVLKLTSMVVLKADERKMEIAGL